jgi:hypothetical protein
MPRRIYSKLMSWNNKNTLRVVEDVSRALTRRRLCAAPTRGRRPGRLCSRVCRVLGPSVNALLSWKAIPTPPKAGTSRQVLFPQVSIVAARLGFPRGHWHRDAP